MDHYEVLIKDAVVDALQEMAFHEVNGEGLSYSAPWQLVGEADSLLVYKKADLEHRGSTIGRVFGRLRADFDDVMGFFYSDNSKDYFKVNQLMHHETLDARVISVMRKRDRANPFSFFGVKYLCYQPVPSIPPRDMVFVEYIGYARDAKGRTVGFQATLPLDPQDTPNLGHTMRVPRVRQTNVCLVRRVDGHENQTAVFTTGSYDMRESNSNMNAFFKKYMETLRDIAVLMDSKRISSHEMLSKNNWVPDSLRKSCYVCTRSFGATRHRHHCRMCGEVVCKKCLVVRQIAVAEGQGAATMTKLKVCMFCVQKTRTLNNVTPKDEEVAVHGRSRSPTSSSISHTITSSMDRPSYYSSSADSSDRSSTYSFDVGFSIRSPSRRYSDMSEATTIFEKEEEPVVDNFMADLYIDTSDMASVSSMPRSRTTPPHGQGDMHLLQRTYSGTSPRSAHSGHSGRSGRSGRSSSNSYRAGSGHQPQQQYMRPPPQPQLPQYPQYGQLPQHSQHALAPQPQPGYNASYKTSTSVSRERGPSNPYQFGSIDQQLAEQQEILRQMTLASNHYGHPRGNQMPDPRYR
ncbi:hypothetical protein Poli38472_000056 [Pythium oligandrum]|uniref:FYVE-type domain-containing protein n=1 Tax=Pythium oligandrum TaxID=41045 RepID=A0A8K1FGH5_PYTOL|nr:hypothetical protein Poli38472_000056 [Pythium oligandrum]|eukprot:TMW60014.1 hypothetical protein Poli38472_000056 [Pythium oligandrum]